MAEVVDQIGKAGGWLDNRIPNPKGNNSAGWDLVINSPTGTVTLPSNAMDNPERDTHLITFYSDAVQQTLSQLDLTPSPDFAAKWSFTPEPATPDVAIQDLRKAIFEGSYRYIQNEDSSGKWIVTVDPIPDSGAISFTSRDAHVDLEQATFDPVPVQGFFRQLSIQPDSDFAAKYPHAVPYQYRPPLNPAPADDPAPTPPPSMRDQIQQNVDEHNAVDTQNAMDALDQAEQQRAQQEQDEIQREADQRRAEQAELDRQQAERQRQQEGERGGVR